MPKTKKIFSKKQKSSLLSMIMVFVLLVIIGASGLFLFSEFKKPRKIETVKVGLVWLHQAQFAGIYTAIEKGFYEDVGLNIELEEFEFSKSIETELDQGRTDFSVLHPIRLLNGVSNGLEIQAVSAIYQTSPFAFISKKDTKLDKPSDFRGKVFGFKGDNVASKILYSALLSELDLKEKDVNFKKLDFSTHEFEDIQGETVDIINLYRTDQVYLFEQSNVPYKLVLPEDFRFNMYGDVIATSDKMIEDNPQLVQKFVDATIKGWIYAEKYPEKAIEMTMKYVQKGDYKDVAYNQFILEKSLPLIDVSGGDNIGHMSIEKWKSLYDAMIGSDTLIKEFDINEAFTTQFID